MPHFHAEDGAKLAYRDEGQGLCVLALAGLTRDGRDFDYLAPHLGDIRLIRLDSRGRGGSDWTGHASYTVPREAADALALLDHLGIDRAAVIGSSRGGLIGMFLAATARQRLSGLCMNDVGPVLEKAGLDRIVGYLGVRPQAKTLEAIAAALPLANPGFFNVPASRWREEAERHFRETETGVELTYDPELRQSFETAVSGPAVDLWPLFDALKDLPIALIRAENSDLLSREAAQAMQARRPDMINAETVDRAHIPFLDEPEALAAIRIWLDRVKETA
ncbi:pimeloyl-ACP methyl ester carboxylesterase [Rhizobium sp. SG_E_25_P2]|uniref:alpha/beta fold hydrolase n=1 Tax=Rhizobium sp. SG_E_25_P2 TaxID=2879942 RepID=UPI002472F53F|nr:alpha/beta hydrolase [Rhizobium sp. SG_E_25_P2]MDH6268490.1 pimeloyl-ACP methyl ester carboxylesterase [Rhizobium sp. SG_E_25_P2]